MELRQYSALILRWWWLLVLSTALAAGAAFLVTRTKPPVYQATSTLFINQLSTPGTLTYSDALLNQQLVKTYSQMVVKPVVLDVVRSRLKLSYDTAKLARMVSAQPVPGTQLLTITVEGNSPPQVRDIANAVAQVFIEQQRPYLPRGQSDSAIRIAQPALLPAFPVGPKLALNTVMAGAMGLLLGLATVALLEYLDDTIKTPEELEQTTSLVDLGTVMRLSSDVGAPNQLLSEKYPRNAATEAYRLVRMNLAFASVDQPLVTLLVSSAGPGEGKSTTVANLAIVAAQSGKRVIVVDTDLRKPSLHRIFGLDNRRGITNLMLTDPGAVATFLIPTPVKGVSLLASGPLPRNPAELLASSRMATVIDRLKDEADLILFDSPPILVATDSVVLASRLDGVLLVVDAGHTRTAAVRRAREMLAKSGARVLGGVLNRANRQAWYYDYYPYHDVSGRGSANGRHSTTDWLRRWRKSTKTKAV